MDAIVGKMKADLDRHAFAVVDQKSCFAWGPLAYVMRHILNVRVEMDKDEAEKFERLAREYLDEKYGHAIQKGLEFRDYAALIWELSDEAKVTPGNVGSLTGQFHARKKRYIQISESDEAEITGRCIGAVANSTTVTLDTAACGQRDIVGRPDELIVVGHTVTGAGISEWVTVMSVNPTDNTTEIVLSSVQTIADNATLTFVTRGIRSVVSGAVANSTKVTLTAPNCWLVDEHDEHDDVVVGHTVTGAGISGAVTVTAVDCTTMELELSSAQTIADATTLTFASRATFEIIAAKNTSCSIEIEMQVLTQWLAAAIDPSPRLVLLPHRLLPPRPARSAHAPPLAPPAPPAPPTPPDYMGFRLVGILPV